MDCNESHELISANLDAEASTAETELLTAHLDTCSPCLNLQSQLLSIHRALRIREAVPTPDFAPALMLSKPAPRLGHGEWIRYLLGLIASTSLLVGLPTFFASGPAGHNNRHLGAFTLAMSVGLLFAAVKPKHAAGLLPMTAALALTMTVGAVIDLGQGQRTLFAESQHVLDLAGLSLLWVLSGVGINPWGMLPKRHAGVV